MKPSPSISDSSSGLTPRYQHFLAQVEALGLRFPVAEIHRRTNAGKGNISQYLNRKREPSENFLRKFEQEFSAELHGNASTKGTEEQLPYHLRRLYQKITEDDYVVLPTWSGGAQASADEQFATDVAEQGFIRVPRDLFEDAEAVLPVFGNSMLPGYPPSTQLALALDRSKFFENGEVYVLKLKGKVRPLFKRCFESDKGEEYITLESDNTMVHESGSRKGKLMYPPQDIPKEMVEELWEVLGHQGRRKNKAILLRELREKQYKK